MINPKLLGAEFLMTEPKVVHEWDTDQYQQKITEGGDWLTTVHGETHTNAHTVVGEELARLVDERNALAARVQELKAENSYASGCITEHANFRTAAEAENTRLAARVQELETEHCRDCCCARAWEALDVAEYDGKSIPEHIILLRDYAAEQSDLAADRKDEIRHHKAENTRLRERVQELESMWPDQSRMTAEITRLRKALERITEISAKDSGYADYSRWQMMLTEARRALKEKP